MTKFNYMATYLMVIAYDIYHKYTKKEPAIINGFLSKNLFYTYSF